MAETDKAIAARVAKAKASYDDKIAKYGRVIRLEEWIDSRTKILHRCTIHGEEHKASPSDLTRGQGLKCCKDAQRKAEGERRRSEAASKYDKRLSEIGKLERIEPYMTAITPILHRCTEHGMQGLQTPNAALSGKGLKCCQAATISKHIETQKHKGRERFERLLGERTNLQVLEEYIDMSTPILFRCLLHNQESKVPPKYLLRRSGLGGFSCCRDAQIQKQADERKSKAARLYDIRIAEFGRIKRLEPYNGREKPILHKCIQHDEEHPITPRNALRGDGLICCNRGTGWDSLERILDEKPLKSNVTGDTELYIYGIRNSGKWHKIGISVNTEKRSRDPASQGIYGELCGCWVASSRRNAVLLETALLRDPHLELPTTELAELETKAGFSEIRGGDREALIAHAQRLFDLLEERPEQWAEWALANIPRLRRWETKKLQRICQSKS